MYNIERPVKARSTDAVAALSAGWRRTLIQAMDLRRTSFQLSMGTAGLRTDDGSGFYQFADTVPGNGEVNWFKGSAGLRRSQAYLAMLRGMLPVHEYGLHGVLGVHYADWIQCRNEDRQGVPQWLLFRDWAESCLDARLSKAAIRIFDTTLGDPVNRALDAYYSARNCPPYVGSNGRVQPLPLYSGGAVAAQAALDGSRRSSLHFDSRFLPISLVPQSRSQRGARFFASGLPEAVTLENKVFSGHITISGRVDHSGIMGTRPEHWCDAYEIDRAWAGGRDTHVWDNAASGCAWDRFFGSNGGLVRRSEKLLVVGGFDLTMICAARFTPAEFVSFQRCARNGIWPLQAVEGRPLHRMTLSHKSDGSVAVRMRLSPDKMQIWGGCLVGAPY